MEDPGSLEDHLTRAPIDAVVTAVVAGGGGHPEKRSVLIRGGIGALAKLAGDERMRRQALSERTAYVVALDLGFDDVVPVTVIREIPTENGDVMASVQIVWPGFRTADELGIQAGQCSDDEIWRAGILDELIQNGDRNGGNWGRTFGDRLALIDHGHSAISGQGGAGSVFTAERRSQNIPGEHVDVLRDFVNSGGGRLTEFLDAGDYQPIVDRAERLVDTGEL